MITRKHLLIVIVATCLVTMFLLMIVPIFSLPYDPTLDVNHDGKIDGKDIALPALSYGTAGDPTVPVNVTNFPSTYEYQYWNTINYSQGSYSWTGSDKIYCGGYSKMVISMKPLNISQSLPQNYSITLTLTSIYWEGLAGETAMNENHWPSGIQNYTIEITSTNLLYDNIPVSNPILVDVKAPYCSPLWNVYTNNAPIGWWITFNIYVYLRNE